MPWWETFFDAHYLRMYNVTLPAERSDREAQAVLDILALPAGAKLLDLCCGQGRHAVRFAKAGMQVTGYDLSPTLLEAARREAEVTGVELALVQGDMRELSFQGEFDAIVNLFTAFGYFDSDADNARVVQGVARALRPGGRFLIDLPNIYYINSLDTWRSWHESDIGPVLQDRAYDPLTGRDTTTFYWFEGAERKSRSFTLRTYTSYEMAAMVQEAGLTVVKLYGGFDKSDYHVRNSRRLMILAKKDN